MSIFKFCFHNIFKHSPWFQSRETLNDMRCGQVVETTGYVNDEKQYKSAQSVKSVSKQI